MVQIGIRIEPINTSISDDADALQSLAMVQISIRMSNLCISAEVCRQMRVLLLVWRGLGCAGWTGSPRTSAFSCRGQRVELWRSHWLKNDKKTVES